MPDRAEFEAALQAADRSLRRVADTTQSLDVVIVQEGGRSYSKAVPFYRIHFRHLGWVRVPKWLRDWYYGEGARS